MTIRLAALAVLAAAAAPAAQAASVDIKDAVARVTVVPENRTDVTVEIVRANPDLPISVRTLAGRTIVDGDLDRRIRGCRGAGEGAQVQVRGVGAVKWADMPQVVIRTPRNVDVEADGAVFGAVGRSAALEVKNAGCGDWTIANVEGPAAISQAGSGDTRLGSSGSLKVRVAGSGGVSAAEVRNGLEVTIAGSGSAHVAAATGELDISIAGSGDVEIGGGRATAMKVSIAGSGDVDFKGSADTLRARIAGSGDIHASEVRGEVSKSVMGSGSVRVGS